MAPPTYGDLGKTARDVFGKGYHFGTMKLECKTKTANGVEITSNCSQNMENSKVLGSLETKYKAKEYGLTFTEKWNTDNTLATEISLEDQVTKGLKLSLDSSFAPQSGKKSARLKSQYKQDSVSINADVDLDLAGPVIYGAAVFGYSGWLAGYQMAFDTSKSKLSKSNFSLGFSQGDFQLHTNVNDGQEFGGSIYQKVDKNLETAIQLGWTAGSNATRFSLGCKYVLDKDASLRAKINNSSHVGLGYQQKIRDGVTLTLSAMIDAKNFNQGGHKLGLALDMEA